MIYEYENPIIRGFNPDPSICRVGDDFYIVVSTFEFFPGVLIYHSRNLSNWELAGHCLTTARQIPLQDCGHSWGIYAPTLRYHDGTFFMTTTNAASIRNFIVYTRDLSRGWSDPICVAQTGIDPSLFFDGDGKTYYSSTCYEEDGRAGIQMCEINPFTGELYTAPRVISHGCGGCYPEGAHIYKRNGFYYLVLAEGGTEYGHHATVQRSESVWGPYIDSPGNPLLFHQNHLGSVPIQAVGHADFVEDQNGNWWTVCLGIRPLPHKLLHNLGRETFLAPLTWTEDGWPVAGNNGQVALKMQGPLPGEPEPLPRTFRDDFSPGALRPHWSFLRNPQADCYSLTENPGFLTLRGSVSLSALRGSPAFVGVRQPEHIVAANVLLSGKLSEGQRAGITAYYTCDYHYEIYLKRMDGRYFVGVNRRIHDLEAEVFCSEVDYSGSLGLSITADERWYRFFYQLPGASAAEACQGAVAGLCTEGTAGMTFTGTFLGLFTDGGRAMFSGFEMKW